MSALAGQDVVLQFMKGGDYFSYACATDCSIDFTKTKKSVKTIGDGVWTKERMQNKSYVISLSGLIKFDDGTVPHAFDLYDYYDQGVDIQFRMIFTDVQSSLIKVFTGTASVDDLNLGGGSEGAATGTATLKGNGPPTISDSFLGCTATVGAATVGPSSSDGDPTITAAVNYSGLSVSTTRLDYTVDGGGRLTIFSPGTSGVFFLHSLHGAHELIIYPICANGEDGTPFTVDFTIP